MAPNSQQFLAFIATLIRRRLDDEYPSKPVASRLPNNSMLPGVGKARYALEEGGTAAFSHWLTSSTRLLLADTSLERLQSPQLVSPVRTAELCEFAAEAVRLTPELNIFEITSSEAIGDAIGRAHECPFRRIEELRRAAPGLVFRATISAASSIGEAAAPRNSLAFAADELADAGIDIIRIGDPYNDASRLAEAVTSATLSNAVVEGVVAITAQLYPTSAQIHIDNAVETARMFEQNGVHTIVIEDRCGLLRPVGAYTLVRAIRREVNLPIWVRVAELCGYGLATLVAAVEAGSVGVDTILPSMIGCGVEPSSLALAIALSDTERKPEVDVLALDTLDEHVHQICQRLGGWRAPKKTLPDAADIGVTPQIIETVLNQCGGVKKVSRDQILAACESARSSLGEPAMIPPAPAALVSLVTQMIHAGEDACTLLDRARADDPEGILDSMGNLREGGFPQGSEEVTAPPSRDDLLKLLWNERATQFLEHQSRFGYLELFPSAPLRYGLGVGEELSSLVDGEPYTVHILTVNEQKQSATIEINGNPIELRLPPSTRENSSNPRS